jgi:hypothetical protein
VQDQHDFVLVMRQLADQPGRKVRPRLDQRARAPGRGDGNETLPRADAELAPVAAAEGEARGHAVKGQVTDHNAAVRRLRVLGTQLLPLARVRDCHPGIRVPQAPQGNQTGQAHFSRRGIRDVAVKSDAVRKHHERGFDLAQVNILARRQRKVEPCPRKFRQRRRNDPRRPQQVGHADAEGRRTVVSENRADPEIRTEQGQGLQKAHGRRESPRHRQDSPLRRKGTPPMLISSHCHTRIRIN